ncbi:helix-turn-helix domain-containing protein [Achromobacter seleniivolatilans]|uniref:Helix-turn-helix domain-containing protein n=1 Tax=Achromobacter seleniivolatilans TaxID=3047478 RepID=A0ABY9MA10_9BURK|nr:helix-turn-helix domain-containing protein [Achromobacter sp. R39]WMD23816.1 helix-turn-helix domain-containing protein [Achromobacter sp. R39]
MNKAETEGAGPRVLRRGLRVLGVLRQAGAGGMHVVDIARAAGMQRSTVYRYLDVLVEEGYALRESEAPRWRVAELGVMMAGDPHAQAVRSLRPVLRQISDVSGDSAFLICRAANDSLCLHREVGNYPVQVLAVTVGHRQPLGVGAAGLALLAALPPGEAEDVVAQNEQALRAYGGMTVVQMRRLIESTRDRGWSVVGNAAVPGVLGVGVALCDAGGYPRLAISVSSLIDRMQAPRQRSIAELIRTHLAQDEVRMQRWAMPGVSAA